MGIGEVVRRGALAAGAFFCLTAATEAADLVVTKSNLPTLAVGTLVDDGKSLSIPAGSQVTLVSNTGAVLTISGPFDGVPAARGGQGSADPKAMAALVALLQGQEQSASQLGATRGDTPDPSDPFQINTLRSAELCVPQGTPPKIWRPKAETSRIGRGKIKALESGGAQKEITWTEGNQVIAWPEAVPIRNGGAYLIQVPWVTGGASRVILHVIPGDLSPGVQQIAWMAEAGCREQATNALQALK